MSDGVSAKSFGGGPAYAGALLLSLAVAFLLSQARFEEVWRTGAFFDSDDAMRAVQLRDFLAGQSWFDLTAYRLDPPNGQSMHWSRIVDAPLAASQRFFSLFLAPDQAERATRLIFPFTLLAALLAVAGWLGAILSGAAARVLTVCLVTLSGPMFMQFAPGRIDHHAPQIVALAAAFGLMVEGLDPKRARRLAPAAALMALSTAISLENLPFFAPMAAAPAALFVLDGAAARAQLLCFAGAALAAFPILYAAVVPPSAYLHSACDAFSFVHLAAVLVGGASLLALALLGPRLVSLRARAAAVALAGGATLAAAFLVKPECLGDPLRGVDPLLRDLWLSHVVEAMPLARIFAREGGVAVAIAAPVALGLASALWFTGATRGLSRRRWALAAATVAVGLAAGLWQVRVFTSATPLAMAPLAAGIAAVAARLSAAAPLRAALGLALALILSPLGLALGLTAPGRAPAEGERACLAPQALAPLAGLPPARVLGSFSLGSHILAHTRHSVFAAPYHRNNHGNRLAANVFLAPPDRAEALARAAGAGLIVWCARIEAPSPLVAAAPDGLAAMLARGDAPAWLERRSTEGAPLLVFALRPME